MALNPLTAAKIDHGLAKLALDQLEGKAPPPGEVTLRDFAVRCEVSEGTILKIERTGLAKVAVGLMSQGMPPYLAKKLARILQA